jgi:L-rhamnonate dehydratase
VLAAKGVPAIKITDVECIMIRLPVVRAIGDGTQDTLIVKVHTDTGVTGVGEAHTSPWAAKAVIEAPLSSYAARGLRDIVVGESPLDPVVLWDRMYSLSLIYGRRGVVMHAISAIDMACWDILGKVTGQPIHRLLGGAYRGEVRPYASTLAPDTPEETLREAAALAGAGFPAIKFGWGALGKDTDSDLRFVARVRETVGPDVDIMIDVGMDMGLSNAARLARGLNDHGVFFLEEPLSPDDLAGFAQLVAQSPVPIATGEKETTRFGFRDLMDTGGLRIIQPDVARVGGFTEARRVADMARLRGVTVIPHCWSTDILVAATLHFIASLKECPYLEFCVVDNPIRRDIARNPIRFEQGVVRVPQGPGLGIELNEETIGRLRFA